MRQGCYVRLMLMMNKSLGKFCRWTAVGGPNKQTIAFDLHSVIPAAQLSGGSAVFPPWVPLSVVLPFLVCFLIAVSFGFSLLLQKILDIHKVKAKDIRYS